MILWIQKLIYKLVISKKYFTVHIANYTEKDKQVNLFNPSNLIEIKVLLFGFLNVYKIIKQFIGKEQILSININSTYKSNLESTVTFGYKSDPVPIVNYWSIYDTDPNEIFINSRVSMFYCPDILFNISPRSEMYLKIYTA